MSLNFSRACSIITLCLGAISASHGQNFEAPVTLKATLHVTSTSEPKVSATGTEYAGKIRSFKFVTADFVEPLAYDLGLEDPRGCKLVARWSSGDTITDYRYFIVKGDTELELTGSLRFAPGSIANAIGFKDRWKDGAPVSGSGSYKIATQLNWNDGYADYYMAGITDATYKIGTVETNGSPVFYFTKTTIELTGGAIADEIEGVVEMTITIGKPKVLPQVTI